MSRAVLSLGSNVGDRGANLRNAVTSLSEILIAVSGVYETDPWGDPDQPDYLNAVLLAVDPGASPHDWLRRAAALEQAAGRVRDPDRQFGPRTLDVDVIAVWDDNEQPVTTDDPDLTLPHPRAHLRAFVLRPWLDIQPYGQLPGHGWLYDLVRSAPILGELTALRPREDIHLDS